MMLSLLAALTIGEGIATGTGLALTGIAVLLGWRKLAPSNGIREPRVYRRIGEVRERVARVEQQAEGQQRGQDAIRVQLTNIGEVLGEIRQTTGEVKGAIDSLPCRGGSPYGCARGCEPRGVLASGDTSALPLTEYSGTPSADARGESTGGDGEG